MDRVSSRTLVIGFIAGALAVVTAHQLMYVVVTQLGLAKLTPWSMRPVAPFGVPTILNGIFWGGLWGVLFALVAERLPGRDYWQKGLVYGLMVVVVSNWLLLPLIKGALGAPNQVLLAGGDPKRLLAGALILGAFGIALGIFYRLLRQRA